MIPKAAEVGLTPEDRAVLEARIRAPTTKQSEVLRARLSEVLGPKWQRIFSGTAHLPGSKTAGRTLFLPAPALQVPKLYCRGDLFLYRRCHELAHQSQREHAGDMQAG